MCFVRCTLIFGPYLNPLPIPLEDSSLLVGVEATNTADLDGVIKDAGGNFVVLLPTT